ncbi:hypothetical protein A0U92_03300 [Acetobacter aceti]|uniref:Transposase n=1 Tax=Acetobacter aceti TaxID=435 RepID=A0A1U9KDZ4_ACEAC|nr:hypothetical protein A0U92_03300 [Acetobacter aceti]
MVHYFHSSGRKRYGPCSRRQAAERFGVSPASAVRWCALAATTGSAAAGPCGGDRLSHRIEAQAERIHTLIAQKDDLTLPGIRARLAEESHHFAIGTLWRFFARLIPPAITFDLYEPIF